MGNAIRKIVVVRKAPKRVLVVADTPRMRSQMEKIRKFGYECMLSENVGGATIFLKNGKRVNIVVLDLRSSESAEKLISWIKENRPGVRTVCVNTVADLLEVPRIIHGILEEA